MREFKKAAAQVASVRGDIARNIRIHAAAIESAAEKEISVLVFPELSLTGYELDLAAELAITSADERLAPLTPLAHRHRMAVVVGAPAAEHRDKAGAGGNPVRRSRLGPRL